MGRPQARITIRPDMLGVYAMDKICTEMIRLRDEITGKSRLCILGGGGFMGNTGTTVP